MYNKNQKAQHYKQNVDIKSKTTCRQELHKTIKRSDKIMMQSQAK